MAGILPLLIALITVHTAALVAGRGAEEVAWLPLLLSLLAWAAISQGVCRWLRVRSSEQSLRRSDALGTGPVMRLNVWRTLELGSSGLSTWSSVLILPALIALILHWAALGHAAGFVQARQRRAILAMRLRLVVLPVLVLILGVDVLHWMLDQGLAGSEAGAWLWWLAIILALSLPIVVLAMMPPLLVRLWGAQAITDPQQDAMIRAWANEAGVRVRSVLSWPMRGMPFYNAAVIGLFPRLRYVLISQDLLRDFATAEVQAVLGHELGHARHGHLWMYLAFLLASGLLAQVMSEPLVSGPLAAYAWLQLLTIIAIWGVILRIGFGVISRACERQADMAGAELAGDPAHMASALASLSRLTGSSPHEPNWRHYSIAQRIAFMDRMRLDPRVPLVHHRYIMNLRIFILLLLILGLSLTFFAQPRAPELSALRDGDSVLHQALITAEGGDHHHLRNWLIQQSSNRRQLFARALLTRLEDDQIMGDDRQLYAHRHWLLPFAGISTGDDALDLQMDNALAYGLVAGTDAVPDEYLAIAQQLLPALTAGAERMESRGQRLYSAALWDTVACIHFVADDREAAINAFQRGQEQLTDLEGDNPAALRRIINARLRAASDPQAHLPRIWGSDGDLSPEGMPLGVDDEDESHVDEDADDADHEVVPMSSP
ncbi:MAG: hypothetical protein EA401_11835 [Planctomycetota bacterium]|nr:MAG: hypothetical protein EA401_11835 [Planctomycetota bacterium]